MRDCVAVLRESRYHGSVELGAPSTQFILNRATPQVSYPILMSFGQTAFFPTPGLNPLCPPIGKSSQLTPDTTSRTTSRPFGTHLSRPNPNPPKKPPNLTNPPPPPPKSRANSAKSSSVPAPRAVCCRRSKNRSADSSRGGRRKSDGMRRKGFRMLIRRISVLRMRRLCLLVGVDG